MTKTRDLADLGGGFIQAGTGAVQRTVESKLQDVVSVKDFGAVGDGTTDDTTAVLNAIIQAEATGKVLRFGRGTFLITQIDRTLTADLSIDLDGATIKGTALETAILVFRGADTKRFNLNGPGVIDGTERVNNPGEGSGSGLRLQRTLTASVNGVHFEAGTDTDGFGDSGIVVEYSQDTRISNCSFNGWDDHDIYITGSSRSVSYPSKCLTINNCTFRNNGAGSIRVAREFSHVAITGNVFDAVQKAVILSGGATNYRSGHSVLFTGNVIKSCDKVAFDAYFIYNGLVVSGNLFHDWGTHPENNTCINLRGVSNAVVVGNVLRPSSTAVTNGCEQGIYLQKDNNQALQDDSTDPEWDPNYFGPGVGAVPEGTVVQPCDNNLIANNVIEVIDNGAVETWRACISDLSGGTTNIFANNKLTCGYGRYVYTLTGGVQRTQDPQIIAHTPTGLGVGTYDPQAYLDVRGDAVVETLTSKGEIKAYDDGGTTDDAIRLIPQTTANEVRSSSPVGSAQKLFINSTTDDSHTTPTSGALGVNIRVLNTDKLACGTDDIRASVPIRLPVYATGSLPTTGIVAGSLAYDSTTGTVKFYNGSVWANI